MDDVTTPEPHEPVYPAAGVAPAPAETVPDPADTRTSAEEAKFRRLFEKAQKELDGFKADAAKKAEAEMSELQKATSRAEQAEAKAEALSHDRLLSKIARETGIGEDAAEFLTGKDEETLRAQAHKLAALVKPATVVAGTRTQPAAGQTVSIDEQITAAEKSGNAAESIRLKMAKLMS